MVRASPIAIGTHLGEMKEGDSISIWPNGDGWAGALGRSELVGIFGDILGLP